MSENTMGLFFFRKPIARVLYSFIFISFISYCIGHRTVFDLIRSGSTIDLESYLKKVELGNLQHANAHIFFISYFDKMETFLMKKMNATINFYHKQGT